MRGVLNELAAGALEVRGARAVFSNARASCATSSRPQSTTGCEKSPAAICSAAVSSRRSRRVRPHAAVYDMSAAARSASPPATSGLFRRRSKLPRSTSPSGADDDDHAPDEERHLPEGAALALHASRASVPVSSTSSAGIEAKGGSTARLESPMTLSEPRPSGEDDHARVVRRGEDGQRRALAEPGLEPRTSRHRRDGPLEPIDPRVDEARLEPRHDDEEQHRDHREDEPEENEAELIVSERSGSSDLIALSLKR